MLKNFLGLARKSFISARISPAAPFSDSYRLGLTRS